MTRSDGTFRTFYELSLIWELFRNRVTTCHSCHSIGGKLIRVGMAYKVADTGNSGNKLVLTPRQRRAITALMTAISVATRPEQPGAGDDWLPCYKPFRPKVAGGTLAPRFAYHPLRLAVVSVRDCHMVARLWMPKGA